MRTGARMSRRTWAVHPRGGARAGTCPPGGLQPTGALRDVLARSDGQRPGRVRPGTSIITVKGRPSYRDKGRPPAHHGDPQRSPGEGQHRDDGLRLARPGPSGLTRPHDHLRRRRHPGRACATSRRRRWPPRRTTAIASALSALDIPFTTKVGIAAVGEKGGPADGKLEPGDVIRLGRRPRRPATSPTVTDQDPAAAGGLRRR